MKPLILNHELCFINLRWTEEKITRNPRHPLAPAPTLRQSCQTPPLHPPQYQSTPTLLPMPENRWPTWRRWCSATAAERRPGYPSTIRQFTPRRIMSPTARQITNRRRTAAEISVPRLCRKSHPSPGHVGRVGVNPAATHKSSGRMYHLRRHPNHRPYRQTRRHQLPHPQVLPRPNYRLVRHPCWKVFSPKRWTAGNVFLGGWRMIRRLNPV